jgi:hypothetical protein
MRYFYRVYNKIIINTSENGCYNLYDAILFWYFFSTYNPDFAHVSEKKMNVHTKNPKNSDFIEKTCVKRFNKIKNTLKFK